MDDFENPRVAKLRNRAPIAFEGKAKEGVNYWSAFHEDSIPMLDKNGAPHKKGYTQARGTNTIYYTAWTWYDARKEAARLLTAEAGYLIDQFSPGLKIFPSNKEEHDRMINSRPAAKIQASNQGKTK